MRLPYHLLQVAGEVVFAARGASIISFNTEGTHLSTWTHPTQASRTAGEPPSKRRKVESVQDDRQDDDPSAEDGRPTGEPDQSGQKRKRGKGGEGQKQDGEGSPIVQVLIATPGGSHIVALTGTDKTIWVFGNDGTGHLTLLSSR
jgi:tRNA (guanine-N(7)-)-methyltransferase subunit TRM82